MRRKSVRLAAIAGIIASIGFAGSASAAVVCAGTAQTAGVCVSVTSGPGYDDCIYVGPPPCIPIHVPGVIVDCWGWIYPNTGIICF